MNDFEKRFLEVADFDCDLTKFPLEKTEGIFINNNKYKRKKYGEVFTPLWLVDKMILKAPDSLLKAKATHDLCAGYGQFTIRMLRFLINNKKGFDPTEWLKETHSFSEYQQNNINKLLYIFGNNINLFTDNVVELPERILEMGQKEFDLVFSNPPYNRGMDLKILSKIEPLCKEMVIVHPSTWALDLKRRYKPFNTFKEQISDKIKSMEFFNGNPIFNIGLFVPCVITQTDEEHKGPIKVTYFDDEYTAVNLKSITKFGKEWKTIVRPFMKQVQTYVTEEGGVWGHNKPEIDSKKYHCQLAAIRGPELTETMADDGFYTVIMKDSKRNKGVRNPNVRKDGFLVWEFDIKEQRDNFINFLKTDFARFCLTLLKNSQNCHYGEMILIPWMDFTQEWNDEKLYRFFKINEETQRYIEGFLPDYYGIREKKEVIMNVVPGV